MKAFHVRPATGGTAGLILLLAEKRPERGADERKRAGILTPGFQPRPRLPSLNGQWLWELVTRYSGATVPDFHGVPCHLLAAGRNNPPESKNASACYTRRAALPSGFFTADSSRRAGKRE